MLRLLLVICSVLVLSACASRNKSGEEHLAYRIDKVSVSVPASEYGEIAPRILKEKFEKVAEDSSEWVPVDTAAYDLAIKVTEIEYNPPVAGLFEMSQSRLAGYIKYGPEDKPIVFYFNLPADPGRGNLAAYTTEFGTFFEKEKVFNRFAERLVKRFKQKVFKVR